MRALGYEASVSSSFVNNPVMIKEEICRKALGRIKADGITITSRYNPVYRGSHDAGCCRHCKNLFRRTYPGWGTQMLAVSAIIKAEGRSLPYVVTTSYVRDDPSANVRQIARQIGVEIIFVDPGFGDIGHSGLARYCIGEVKEGMGAGGAMCLAYLRGHSPETIRKTILAAVNDYC